MLDDAAVAVVTGDAAAATAVTALSGRWTMLHSRAVPQVALRLPSHHLIRSQGFDRRQDSCDNTDAYRTPSACVSKGCKYEAVSDAGFVNVIGRRRRRCSLIVCRASVESRYRESREKLAVSGNQSAL